jgi:hypothetical protein
MDGRRLFLSTLAEVLGPGLLRSILREVELTAEDLLRGV